jgi:hypothetical protein
MLLSEILLLLFLVLAIYQDFRYFGVHWIVFVVIFGLTVYIALGVMTLQDFMCIFLINMVIILVQGFMLIIYFTIKHKKLTFLLNRYLGSGDICLYIILCSSFSPANFILFFLASHMLTLVIFGITNIRRQKKYIPLAGYLSFFVIIARIIFYTYDSLNLYDDSMILRKLWM